MERSPRYELGPMNSLIDLNRTKSRNPGVEDCLHELEGGSLKTISKKIIYLVPLLVPRERTHSLGELYARHPR